jgi:hypothetical protein
VLESILTPLSAAPMRDTGEITIARMLIPNPIAPRNTNYLQLEAVRTTTALKLRSILSAERDQ